MRKITLEDLEKQLNWYSGAVSNSVRIMSFGVIASIWAVFTADGITLQQTGLFGVPSYLFVRLAFIFAAGALFTDILQYVSAYWMTSIGYEKFEEAYSKNSKAMFAYDCKNIGCYGVFLYKVSFILFPIKLLLSILSALTFLLLAFGINISSS